MNSETKKATETPALQISPMELASLGGGEIAYVKELTSDEAERLFPAVKDLPRGIHLFALHAADGTPIALTDSMQAAIGHAAEDDLEVARVH